MKKIVVFIIFFFTTAQTAIAQSPTPTTTKLNQTTTAVKPTATISGQMDKIQELKDRLATKVAQLKLSKKRVLIGTISSLDNQRLAIETKDGIRKIETNEDTAINQTVDPKLKILRLTDLKKGQPIIAWGTYYQEGDILTATGIFVKEVPLGLLGTVSDVNLKGGTVSLQTLKTNQSYLLDVEIFTKINSLDKDNKMVKLGFSKIKVGSIAYIYAVPQTKEGSAPFTAYRIIVLPNPPITVITPESVSPTATPSATPTKKPTPTP